MRRLVTLVAAVAVVAGGGASRSPRTDRARSGDAARGAHGRPAGDRVHGRGPDAGRRGSLSAHLASLDAISPALFALGPGGTIAYRDADAFAQGLAARGAALYPVLRDPQRRIGLVLARTAPRKRAALGSPRWCGPSARRASSSSSATCPPPIASPCRRSCASSARPARQARLLLVVPPIGDATTARREDGYDLRDLARPATLVLQAFGGPGHAAGPHPIAALGW